MREGEFPRAVEGVEVEKNDRAVVSLPRLLRKATGRKQNLFPDAHLPLLRLKGEVVVVELGLLGLRLLERLQNPGFEFGIGGEKGEGEFGIERFFCQPSTIEIRTVTLSFDQPSLALVERCRRPSMFTDLGLSSVLSRHCATVLVLGGRRVEEEKKEKAEKTERICEDEKKKSPVRKAFDHFSIFFFFPSFRLLPRAFPAFSESHKLAAREISLAPC